MKTREENMEEKKLKDFFIGNKRIFEAYGKARASYYEINESLLNEIIEYYGDNLDRGKIDNKYGSDLAFDFYNAKLYLKINNEVEDYAMYFISDVFEACDAKEVKPS